MTQRLVLEKDMLSVLGTFSIQGMAVKAGFPPGPLTIVFRGSSSAYCRDHDGPELLIMPDYVPYCIVESILQMQRNGWDISVELDDS
jgi:hypothetical protein